MSEKGQTSVEQTVKSKRKGIYLLPNLLTTCGLFAGFYAIVAAMRGEFDNSAIAIFIAMIMDGLDGRVARVTNTQSAFGAEYDSQADIVSFGIAPSLVVYKWGLISLGKVGWLVAFFYAAATALRLARFNSTLSSGTPKYFQGLPCPSAAGLVAGMVWVAHDISVPGQKLWYVAAIVTLIAAVLMVSNIRFYSFKDIDWRGNVPFVFVLVALIVLMFIAIDPPKVLLASFGLYVLSGPSVAGYRTYKAFMKRRARKQKSQTKSGNL